MNAKPIDFAPRSVARLLARTHPLVFLVAVLGAAGCLFTVARLFELTNEVEHAKTELYIAQQAVAKKEVPRPLPSRIVVTQARASAINSAIAQLNLPWFAILDALDVSSETSVAVLSLEPDAKKRRLRAVAEARSSGDMLGYIEHLKRDRFFTCVDLTKHEVNEQDPEHPLRFQFEACWEEGAE